MDSSYISRLLIAPARALGYFRGISVLDPSRPPDFPQKNHQFKSRKIYRSAHRHVKGAKPTED